MKLLLLMLVGMLMQTRAYGKPTSNGTDFDLEQPVNDTIYGNYRRYGYTVEKSSAGIGTLQNPAADCNEIKKANMAAVNGLYNIIDTEGNVFITYCDMTTDGGGWTLVASIHENNINGKCTSGDRWSSEQGSNSLHPDGDGFWENRAVHGSASSATSDDYKNFGYFGLKARDIMIWHVPNDTPLDEYETSAYFKYYTRNAFLWNYGRNLQKLFTEHFPMRSQQYTTLTDNGPSVPITYARGSDAGIMTTIANRFTDHVEPGYVQFRAINTERSAFALCPGVRIKSTEHVEHMCAGSTSYHPKNNYCGDHAARDWFPEIQSIAWESAIMVFYR